MQEDVNAANRELERALESVRPAGVRMDPVTAAFAAGRRSARGNLRWWRGAAVVGLVVGVGGNLMATSGRKPASPAEVGGPALAARHEAAPVSEQSVLVLQQAMRDRGMAGLPDARTPAVGPVRAREFF